MKRTMNFILDNPSRIVPELEGRSELRMVLWAGDCVHDGITDIERLPNFDVYLCMGFINTLQANVDYMYNNRSKSGVICIIDVFVKEQMNRFVELFRGRFSVIDSDYNGNTPTLPREYYDSLLSEDGKGFNVKGINGCSFPVEDVQNALELFAPILSREDNYRRTWTKELIEIAKINDLSPSSAWTSPDFKEAYYDRIREGQEQLMKWNENRNPFSSQSHHYSKDNIEEYWKLLPLNILTVNIERNNIYDNIYKPYSTMCIERFRSFIVEHIIPMIKTSDEFRENSRDMTIKTLQDCYRLCKEYPGIKFGRMEDNRRGGKIYAHWISRKN
jgi:hypothetical protein